MAKGAKPCQGQAAGVKAPGQRADRKNIFEQPCARGEGATRGKLLPFPGAATTFAPVRKDMRGRGRFDPAPKEQPPRKLSGKRTARVRRLWRAGENPSPKEPSP